MEIVLGILVVALVLMVVGVLAQRRRRAGGVMASRGRRGKR